MTIYTAPLGFPKPEGTDPISQGYDAIGDLADAVDDAIVADRARLTALESLDSGWVAISLVTGTWQIGGATRRIGPVVYARGGWSAAGLASNTTYSHMGTIDPAHRPSSAQVVPISGSSGASRSMAFIHPDGRIELRVGTLAGYQLFAGATWLVD
jgi:hypothetical protein